MSTLFKYPLVVNSGKGCLPRCWKKQLYRLPVCNETILQQNFESFKTRALIAMKSLKYVGSLLRFHAGGCYLLAAKLQAHKRNTYGHTS